MKRGHDPGFDAAAPLPLSYRFVCRSGEIGIRTRLKIWRSQGHVGSSPTSGTIRIKKLGRPASVALLLAAPWRTG